MDCGRSGIICIREQFRKRKRAAMETIINDRSNKNSYEKDELANEKY